MAGPTRAKRLSAAERRASILAAARQAFSETGDMNGTTVRAIAEKGGISEGVIYRHFESKDQLFIEAVVEPLRAAIDELVAATEAIDEHGPLGPDRQRAEMPTLYRQLISTFEEVLPLLGLVLFGDPQTAGRFYREHLAAAMDRLAGAWRTVDQRHAGRLDEPEVAVRAVMGVALMAALERRHGSRLDTDAAIRRLADGTIDGFLPLADEPSG